MSNKVLRQLQYKTVPIKGLRPAPYNPRIDLKPGDPRYEGIRASLEQYGQVQPLVYTDKRRYILGGAQRLKIMRDMGFTEVHVVIMNFKSLDQEKAFNMALNKVGGAWDIDKLALLKDEGVFDSDFFTGFSEEEVEEFTKTHPEEDPLEPPVDPGAGSEGDEPTVYQVVVDCTDDQHQKQVLKRIRGMKLTARAVTL